MSAAEFHDRVEHALEPEEYPGDERVLDAIDDRPGFVSHVFEITTDGAAGWAMRKRRRALAEIDAAEMVAAELRAEADRYVEDVRRQQDRTVRAMEFLLRRYYETRMAARGPKDPKTVPVPGGKLLSRVGGVSARVTNVDALREWLLGHRLPELLRPPKEPEPEVTLIRKRFAPDVPEEPGVIPAIVHASDPLTKGGKRALSTAGEIVPGVVFERGVPSFTIEDEELGR